MPPDLPAAFVDLTGHPALRVELRYAGPDNFVGRPVYGGFDRLLLHPLAAEKLLAAAALLRLRRADLVLLVLDGWRPGRVQRLFWNLVAGTPQQRYVADPAAGSVHSYGLAVDVTLARREGGELDMGTAFDDFSPLAEPAREAEFAAAGLLRPGHLAHRLLLRQVMTEAGLLPIPEEWWHFDALPPAIVRRDFKPVG